MTGAARLMNRCKHAIDRHARGQRRHPGNENDLRDHRGITLPADRIATEQGRKFLARRGLVYTQLYSDDVQHGLKQFVEEYAIELLALSHHHHSFISKLFGHSESEAAIAKRQCAVLVFPPDFK